LGKHEVKQGVKHELKTLFFTSFLAKFTLLGAEVGTTIINTGQPPPPVSKQRATPKVGMDLANAKLVPTQGATKVGTLIAIAQLMPTREATKVGTDIA